MGWGIGWVTEFESGGKSELFQFIIPLMTILTSEKFRFLRHAPKCSSRYLRIIFQGKVVKILLRQAILDQGRQ